MRDHDKRDCNFIILTVAIIVFATLFIIGINMDVNKLMSSSTPTATTSPATSPEPPIIRVLEVIPENDYFYVYVEVDNEVRVHICYNAPTDGEYTPEGGIN